MSNVTKQILVFLGLTVLLSAGPQWIEIHSGWKAGDWLAVTAEMWAPGLAAFATCALFRVDIASLGWSWRPVRYVWWAYAIPLAYTLPVYVFAWIAIDGALAHDAFATAMAQSWGFPEHPNLATWLLGVPALATFGMLAKAGRALGEEIGWRGFLFPRLTAKLGFSWACVMTGLIWSAWHVPVMLLSDWGEYDSRVAYVLLVFTIGCIAASVVAGWLQLKSRSVWPATIFHASHNLFVLGILDKMTASNGPVVYITTEDGIGLMVTNCLVAFYFWRRRGELEIPKEGEL